ncbi:uncharacterized protein [Dysidea avara]|uniref:uncharacterized protein n=1 Tax=Dysidea avara TaxID=196820 RepID=UPI00331B11E7
MQICLTPGRETENLFGVALGYPTSTRMSRSPSPTGTGADGSSRAPDPTGPVTTSSPPVRFITSTRAGEHRPADCFIPLRQIARTPPGSRLPPASSPPPASGLLPASTPPPASGLLPASIPSPTRMSPAGTSPGRSFADAVRGSPAAGKLACVSTLPPSTSTTAASPRPPMVSPVIPPTIPDTVTVQLHNEKFDHTMQIDTTVNKASFE